LSDTSARIRRPGASTSQTKFVSRRSSRSNYLEKREKITKEKQSIYSPVHAYSRWTCGLTKSSVSSWQLVLCLYACTGAWLEHSTDTLICCCCEPGVHVLGKPRTNVHVDDVRSHLGTVPRGRDLMDHISPKMIARANCHHTTRRASDHPYLARNCQGVRPGQICKGATQAVVG
jgi:hypothetical protein